MRRRPLFWLIISVLCFIGAYYSWRLGNEMAAKKAPHPVPAAPHSAATAANTPTLQHSNTPPLQHSNAFPYRLSNTTKTLAQLDRSDHAILLENALLDTDRRSAGGATAMPAIPSQFRAQGDPGAYIVQSRGPLDDRFRALLADSGATVVSYIPNNAYLVQASQSVADQLKSNPQTQSVLPYEPYYKLKSSLLNAAIENQPLPDNSSLNVLVFTDSRQATVASLTKLGVTVTGEERSPFGTVLKVKPTTTTSGSPTLNSQPSTTNLLSSLASLSGVQEIELAGFRVPANDLSRVRVGVSLDTRTTTNYLNLTGAGVLVSLNDTGVEASRPDLAGRVFGDTPLSILDFDGHGTHVAGIIASSGLNSETVSNALGQGSIMPATNFQFRGKAPAASLMVSRTDLNFGPLSSDAYLQEIAAKTNILISNNSWNYFGDNQYDLPAASYDAAVRDALPLISGSQPVLFVFAAGNSGRGDDSGLGGAPGTIQSPATAKNVITVGYIEQPRNITNQVPTPGTTNSSPIWQVQTDSDNQVAAGSSRGNVGIGIEGQFGRFKPDVVAPGAFVISTRTSTWNGGLTNHFFQYFRNQVLGPGQSFNTPVFLPANTFQFNVSFFTNALSQPGLATLPIYVKQSAPPTQAVFDYTGTSPLVIPNPAPVGAFWNYAVFNNTTSNLVFDILADAVLTNDPTVSQALLALNTNLAPYYRYESGSSMAAADVSGVLALMQEFFQSRFGLTNSPALMKALLINGARTLGRPYDFEVTNSINFQGWGLINLTNSIPGPLAAHSAPSNSVFFVDQSPTNSLATGQSHTYRVDIGDEAALESLRVTLVWTDPPGNPLATKKLVNDLDLIVTNLDDPTQVFVGNYILPGNEGNSPWVSNFVANLDDLKDSVNNVENVYLGGDILATAYSITVVGHRVNVNAVTAHTNDVVQDYALVISCGNGDVTNAMAFSRLANAASTVPFVTGISNQFVDSTTDSGGILINQRVGASSPLQGTNQIPVSPGGFGVITLGETNQWHFFMVTNVNGFTNAAFLTFDSVNLSLPRMGVRQGDVNNASRPDADVDLYVSTDPGLTNLDPAALSAAYKSLGRRGNETIILSNAVPGVYYAGVKAEDQMAAQFSFLGDFAKFPFGGIDGEGNQTLHGIGLPQAIPDGTPANPGGITVLAIGQPVFARRVVVTNELSHQLVGDLVGTIKNQTNTVTLINHSPEADVIDKIYVYDDSGYGDIVGAQPSAGPGTLHDFAGKVVDPQWQYSMSDNAFNHLGTNGPLTIWIEKQLDLSQGIIVCVEPGRCVEEFFIVPDNATAAIVTASSTNTTPLLTIMQVCELGPNGLCSSNVVIGTGNSITLDQNSTPVLIPGNTYVVRLCNPNTTVECLNLKVAFETASEIIPTLTYATNAFLSLPDDAVIYSSIFVSNHVLVRNLDLGLLINHSRVSDLAITLISPNGTRILLFEDRGGFTTNGLGGNFSPATNSLGIPGLAYTNMLPFYTNDFESSAVGLYAPGAVFQGWNVLTNFVDVLPDYSVPWQSNRLLVLGNGIVSNTLPVTNATSYHLSFNITHAPYLVGTVGWWPFDRTIPPRLVGTNLIYSSDLDTPDIFGGHDAILSGDPTNGLGKVAAAYYGDGVATKAVVPRGWDLDLGEHTGRGFSIEGWIKPRFLEASTITNLPITEVARGTVSNHLYIAALATNGITWTLAESKAVAMGGHLASISSAAEQSFVYGLASSSPLLWAREGGSPSGAGIGPWLGGYKTGTVWAWSDGTPFTYTNWSPGEPNNYNNDEDRLEFVSEFGPLMSGSWNDYPDNAVGDGVHLGPNPHGFIVEIVITNSPAPLVEWNDPTNQSPQGVQFWLGGLPGSNNIPGSLWANIWDTNLAPHIVSLAQGPITNGGWQHVALTYDGTNFLARIYTNGQLALSQVVSTTNFVPRTDGDLFFGFHPPGLQNDSCYPGGLDEFALYDRPLSDSEVLAIYNAGGGGKYGTNALSSPVGVEVTLQSLPGNPFPFTTTMAFTNIVSWTNPVPWFTNIDYITGPQFAYTNGPITNLVAISLRPLDPNVAVDNFVLSALTTNFVSGLFHFNEDGRLALGEIKFGPTPYALSNSPPFLVFSNDFESVTQSVYQVGRILPGITNDPAIGRRDWLVTNGLTTFSNSITVVSNAFYGIAGSNWAAMARGTVACALPTVPGQRYKLTYTLHGPCAVGWWNGDVEPLSQRAQDLIGGNHGAFTSGASNFFPGFVGDHALYFDGEVELPPPFDPDIGGDRDDPGTQILLGDPANLRLTNSFTIEGWIQPFDFSDYLGTEQLFFRGDSRQCFDPYYLALEPDFSSLPNRFLHFHVEDATGRGCGTDLLATNDLVNAFSWQHVAAVFETGIILPDPPYVTNMLRLYLRGNLVASNYTDHAPFRDLNQAFSPQIAMGGVGTWLNTKPYRGLMDEMSVYARALTPPEILAIARARTLGKADTTVAATRSLAKLSVLLDGAVVDTGYGNNSTWSSRDVVFTALRTNMVLTLESLEPGTLVDMVTLTAIPSELTYLPEEQSLSELNGQDAYGLWQLEIWDTRVGATNATYATSNGPPQLENWQLTFQLPPIVLPEPVYLSHGITYTNTLRAHGVQYFLVQVPQWATVATNMVLVTNTSVSVYFNQTNFPPPFTNPPVFSGTGSNGFVLLSNSVPPLVIGQSYYMAVTNLNPFPGSIAVTVFFDITPLTNCVATTNFVGPAGIPRYFQFDVPTNGATGTLPQEVTFWLSGANSNMTVVLSQHLPLPDLTYHDYVSAAPGTNDEIVLVLTNTLPFPVQFPTNSQSFLSPSNRWYVGVFNHNATNVPFTVQACYITNYPIIVDLTNAVPFTVGLPTDPFAAPPGPPRWIFFRFSVTNLLSNGILFELYNLSGDADLLLQREVPPGMAPYFDTSFRQGVTPEQIVVRANPTFPDLRFDWYLGVFNNETNNVTYTIRATVPDTNRFLVSAQPFNLTAAPLLPGTRGLLLSWHGVEGETYLIQFSPTLLPPVWSDLATVVATTPFPTYEVYPPAAAFYRIVQVSNRFILRPTLTINLSSINCPPPAPPCVRISWPTSFTGFVLQSETSFLGPWVNVPQPVFIEGNEFVVYDTIGPAPKFYRLFQ